MSSASEVKTVGKKEGGSVWIYTILILVAIVFIVGIVVSLVVAIRKRPRQLYVSKEQEPEKEVFVVLFDEEYTGHSNNGTGYVPPYTNPDGTPNPGSGPVSKTTGTLTVTSSDPPPSVLKLLITNGTSTSPLDGIASQIGSNGSSFTIATKQQCQDAAQKGAVFKYLPDETKAPDPPQNNNYKDLPFLFQDSFGDNSYSFYEITNKNVVPATDTSFQRLSVAFYGVKPTIGDFVTRQSGNNPGPKYGDTSKFRPSCTFKASWIGGNNNPVINVPYRIVPFNSEEFNKFLSDEKNYMTSDVDGRIKYWSANYPKA